MTTPSAPGAAVEGDSDSTLVASYDRYFATGYYHARYPAPNPRTVRALRRLMPARARVLDFGCGDGRYVPPILDIPGTTAVGYDVCPTALKLFAQRFAPEIAAGRVALVGDGLDRLEAFAAAEGRFDLALMGFGVLGHIRGQARRRRTLATIRRLLAPGGHLLVGLPNARRRFRTEQAQAASEVAAGRLEPGDVTYARAAPGENQSETIPLYYHLYGEADARAELTAAGFRVRAFTAESVLPESAVVRSRLASVLDGILMQFIPATWGYGFLVTATPER